MNLNTIRSVIIDQFRLPIGSIHGYQHWRRVEKNGLDIAKRYPTVNTSVIRLFSFLHDSQRVNEDYDPDHGKRASRYVRNLYTLGLLPLTKDEEKLLEYACCFHSKRHAQSEDITVLACWDSDRLDLTRVGIPKYEIKLHLR